MLRLTCVDLAYNYPNWGVAMIGHPVHDNVIFMGLKWRTRKRKKKEGGGLSPVDQKRGGHEYTPA